LRRLRLATAGLLLGCAASVQAAPPVLTLAVADNPFAAPALIAESEGWFAAEGLNLKIVHCAIGRVCLKWLQDGQAHVATVVDTPIVFASFARKDFAVIASLGSSGRDHHMVVRTDRGIGAAADLKGKRIGTLKSTSGHYFTETFLRFNGIDPDEVSIVALDADNVTGALQRGEVDAAGLFAPHVGEALRQLGAKARVLPTLGFFSTILNVVSVPAAAGASDEDLAKLLRALKRADDLIRTQPERARAITAAALKIDARAIEEAWGHYDFRLQLAPTLISSLEAQSRWALRAKLVPADARLPDYLDFVRSGPLRRVDPRAVRLVE
jgi:ABC-type nitrate/sulfonate/bicarbonate transport system substrate-binding protein